MLEGHSQLADESLCNKLTWDLTMIHKKEIDDFLVESMEAGIIVECLCDTLRVFILFLLPKVNKRLLNFPECPIVLGVGSALQLLAIYIYMNYFLQKL